MIEALWNKHCDWLQINLPDAYQSLNAPASSTDFIHFKNATGYEFPEDLKRIYAINNGQDPDCLIGVWWGLSFIPMEDLIEHHMSNKSETIDMSHEDTSFPIGAIKLYNTNPLWIPFAEDGSFNYLAVDLDPDVNGSVRQVINYGRDERDKCVIAANVEQFVFFMTQEIEKGHYTIEVDDRFGDIIFNYKTSHLIDDLKKNKVKNNNNI
jgi:cell wall assembly regulator SMI1